MNRLRGGLLASTGATVAGLGRWAAFGRVPEGEQTGGGGGAEGLLDEEDPAAAAAAAAAAGDDDAATLAAAAAAAAAAKPAEVAEWMKSFSGDKAGDEPSHQEWLAKSGVKDLDGLAQIARDNQKALRESGKVKVPGEGATDAELKAFREAVGAPETAEKYGEGIKLPEGAPDDATVDTALIAKLAPIALKHNVPKAAFDEFAAEFMQSQIADAAGDVAAANLSRDDKFKEWGKAGTEALAAGKEEFRRGANVLGIGKPEIMKIQLGLGVGETMDLVRKIGVMAGEDFLGGGDGAARRFGYSDLDSAQKALRAMESDAATAKKIRDKDPVVYARYKGLVGAVAHFRERAAAAP